MNTTLYTIDDMYTAGATIASDLQPTDIVTLSGDLGSGKTTITKGILQYFGIAPEDVTSPTFSIMNVYLTKKHNEKIQQLVHIDTYRLHTPEELLEIGFEEYVTDPQTVLIIEWPELITDLLKKFSNFVHAYELSHVEQGRSIIKKEET